MPGVRRIVGLSVALLAVMVPPAAATDYCVDVVRTGCTASPTLKDALAEPDRTTIYLGESTYEAADDDGETVRIVGLGAEKTHLADTLTTPSLRLSAPASAAEALSLEAVELAGPTGKDPPRITATAVTGVVTAAGAARVERSTIEGGVVADSPEVFVDDSEIELGSPDAVALDAGCGAVLTARHVTITGDGLAAGRARCLSPLTATLVVRNSVLRDPAAGWDDDPFLDPGGGAITTAYSAHADDADATADHRLAEAPGFVSATDHRLAAGSALIDAGDPDGLVGGELFEDLPGFVRITDGDGDGVVRRDVGAYERQAPPVPLPDANVLANPGAENGTAGWSGTFEARAYGDPFFPSFNAAQALGAGGLFFAGGTTPQADLVQRIDVAGSARAIDGGGAAAALSGLLGGYGADQDPVTLTATFRDPEGNAIGALKIGPVTAEERGRATNLLRRETAGGIPARTRAIDVAIHGERTGGGSYDDAYADNLALVLSVPGVPVDGPVDPGKPVVPGLKPFAGVIVLNGRTRLTRAGAGHVALACVSATVGFCSGTLELRARLPKAAAISRIGRWAYFSLAAGRTTRVELKLLASARKALKRRTAITGRLVTLAHDGQGVQRRRTVPFKLLLKPSAPGRR